jgi:hypothetical protein
MQTPEEPIPDIRKMIALYLHTSPVSNLPLSKPPARGATGRHLIYSLNLKTC